LKEGSISSFWDDINVSLFYIVDFQCDRYALLRFDKPFIS